MNVRKELEKAALFLSLKLWKERLILVNRYHYIPRPVSCALCLLHNSREAATTCGGCIIYEITKKKYCSGTPYKEILRFGLTPALIRKEVRFLQKLYDNFDEIYSEVMLKGADTVWEVEPNDIEYTLKKQWFKKHLCGYKYGERKKGNTCSELNHCVRGNCNKCGYKKKIMKPIPFY